MLGSWVRVPAGSQNRKQTKGSGSKTASFLFVGGFLLYLRTVTTVKNRILPQLFTPGLHQCLHQSQIMASIKVLLYSGKSYSDGTNPVIIQIIENRKIVKKVLHRCLEKNWDAKQSKLKTNAPNSFEINQMISAKLSFYQKALYNISEDKELITKEIFDEVKVLKVSSAVKSYISRMEDRKMFASSKVYYALFNQVVDFKDISIDKVDRDWLEGFSFYLKSELNNGSSTIHKKIKRLKGVMNLYGKSIPNEVKQFKVAVQDKMKLKLTKAELDKIIGLKLPKGDILESVRDFFILQVYLRGVRVGDLLQSTPDNFKADRFVYTSNKTETGYDMSLILPAKAIIDKYAAQNNLALFPFWKWKANPKETDDNNIKARTAHKEACTSLINKYLKLLAAMAEIDKNLTTHIARHSFAVLADESTGGNIYVIQQLLGHSNRATTEGYIKNLRKTDVLDKAADQIFKDIL